MGETHENPEKEAYDQKSGIGKAQTDDEGLKRLELVEAWVNTQFQPLVFSVESNPALSAIMRPYIQSLRDQTCYVANFYSDMVGHQEVLADSYWLAAQKYVDSVGVWARALSAPKEKPFEEVFRMLKEAVPPASYRRKVAELAEEMWRNAGSGYLNPLAFWVSAENHMLAIGARSVANAKTMYDAIETLRRAFSDFMAATYLAGIQRRAFYRWKALGEPSGKALDTWLEAEQQALAFGPTAPPGGGPRD